MPFSSSDDPAQRIQAQTYENLKHRSDEKIAKAEHELAMEKAARLKDALDADKLFDAILGKVDVLLDFIAQRCDGIPPELIELIVERQEQRIGATLPGGIDLADSDVIPNVLPLANIGAAAGSLVGRTVTGIGPGLLPAGQDGQVLRVENGKFGWGDDPSPDFRPKSLQSIRDEVRRLVGHLKEQ